MTNTRFKLRICFLAFLMFADILVAQQKQSSSPSANSPSTTPSGTSQATNGTGAGGASSGTYSIEGEIFAYKSLQLNGKAIAQDVTTLITATSSSTKPGVVVVPSSSAILPAFQLWRSNMLVIQNFLNQADPILQKAAVACPAQKPPRAGPPSFGVYATGVTEAVGVIQSILSLFASSQTVMEFSGTIQDQALVSAVSRELRANQMQVLAPDTFAPWTIDVATPPDSPFVSKLSKLIDDLSHLQDVYQCNQLILGVGSQLQQAEITRQADFAKLQDSSLKDADRTAAINEIRNLTSQIATLRLRLGLDIEAQNVKNSDNAITTAEQILNDPKTSGAQKAQALDTIKKSDAEIMALENPIIATASLTTAKAQSLVTGIQAYLAGLTGGAVSFTSPAASTSAPTGSGTASQAAASPAAGAVAGSATAPGATAATAKTTGDSASASASPTVSSPTSSTPPIVTILQADGLARKMNVQPNEKNTWNFNAWRILWVKSMESGGAIVTESNIWGSKPHFSGGAVSGYALFQLDGTLVCSGNAAAYGGYVKPKDFVNNNSSVGAVEMLNLGGSCKPDATRNEPQQ